MRAGLILTVVALASLREKPITIEHLARVMLAPHDITFDVRVSPSETDTQLTALLCDLDDVCSLDGSVQGEQITYSDGVPRLWRPKPFRAVGAGDYAVLVAVGRNDLWRATDVQNVKLVGP